jgi:Na+/H+ antiporter NhaD/arsenite permease-like protein
MPATSIIAIVFAVTYLGMAVGGVPGLKTDRSGIALIAVAVLLATGAITAREAATALDGTTLAVMFGLMILSAQFAEGGLYDLAAARVVAASPNLLLALTVLVAGGLSALLVNDIVVFAMVPILCVGLRARNLDPRPYLVALAGAGNAGSAATLIGNPQNILIGEMGHLRFWSFVGVCILPALLGLASVYVAVRLTWRKELAVGAPAAALAQQPHDNRQIAKGLLATVVLMILFATHMPHEMIALAVAAFLLASRTVHSRHLIAAVDWPLLLLIGCLFVVTGSMAGHLPALGERLHGMWPAGPESLHLLLPGALVLSNTIGNVPATILLLSLWPQLSVGTLYGLAVLSTLAGNLLIVGSLCNIIVAERAATQNVGLGFTDFARAGIPMTIASMLLASIWLWMGGWMQW